MKIGNKNIDLNERTYVMGILNVTPDSFQMVGSIMRLKKLLKEQKQW